MKSTDKKKILIFGVGNNGRQDDGLGWAFLDFLETLNLDFDIEYRYQLQIEDAEMSLNYDTVIFVDATKEQTKNGYTFTDCFASEEYSFSTHALRPETILFLSNSIYNHFPKSYILGIEGYEWELQIGLTKKAKLNLDNTKEYFKETILNNYI